MEEGGGDDAPPLAVVDEAAVEGEVVVDFGEAAAPEGDGAGVEGDEDPDQGVGAGECLGDADRRGGGPLAGALASLGDALGALEADRGGDHAVGADRP